MPPWESLSQHAFLALFLIFSGFGINRLFPHLGSISAERERERWGKRKEKKSTGLKQKESGLGGQDPDIASGLFRAEVT